MIGSGDGLLLVDNKPLPEPVVTQIFYHHMVSPGHSVLTHWGRVTHLCVSKLASIASDSGLSPGRRQAIIWNNAGLLLIGPLGTYFSEILIEIPTFSLKKICLKISSAKCRPFCLGLNVLTQDCDNYGVLANSNGVILAISLLYEID